MLVHKLIFLCWLVSTCFETSESASNETAATSTSEPGVTTPSVTTASTGQESPSTSVITTVTQSTTASSTPETTPPTQKPEDTMATTKPSEITVTSTPETTPPTQKPEDTTATTKPSETTVTSTPETIPPTQKPEDTTATTEPSETTVTSTPKTTPPTQKPEDTTATTKPSEITVTSTPETTPPTQKPEDTTATTKPSETTVTSTPETTPTTTGNESPGTTTKAPSPSSTPEVTVSSGTQVTTSSPESTPTETTPTEPSTKTTAKPTTAKPPACSLITCPFDSVCIELFDGPTCQCLPGSFFADGNCAKARAFPGNLTLTALVFKDEMLSPESQLFKQTADNIIVVLKDAFADNPAYIESKVLQLSKGSVVAMVDNIFQLTSGVNQESVEKNITNVIEQCGDNCDLLNGATFKEIDPCQLKENTCDVTTTTCKSDVGVVSCPCNSGYISTDFSERSCSVCPSGQKAEKNKCVPCPFGYAGFNCDDSSLLAVVVISCVLGGFLLIMLLAFIIYSSRTKKKNYNSPYPPPQETRTTWSTDHLPVPKIPRASANINAQWDSSHLEMTESGSTRALVAKDRPGNGAMSSYDDLRTFTGKNQSRYSYLNHGQDNPHFISDNGRGTK